MKKSLSLRMDEEVLEKLRMIARCEGRSLNRMAVYFIKKCVREYEENHGEIEIP